MTEDQLWEEAHKEKDPQKAYMIWLQLCRTNPKDYPRTEASWGAFQERLANEHLK